MFPLQRALFPTNPLPLHVFEPRYRELTRHCLSDDRLFGVVLIMRGSEVGTDPDQERSSVGTLARIEQARELPDGRWVLDAAGVERLRVRQWLADDPYPRALVEPWPDPAVPESAVRDLIDAVVAGYDRLLGILEGPESGSAADRRGAVDADNLSSDFAAASFQLCTAAPLGELDRLRLLAADGTVQRLELLAELLEDLEATVRLLRNAAGD